MLRRPCRVALVKVEKRERERERERPCNYRNFPLTLTEAVIRVFFPTKRVRIKIITFHIAFGKSPKICIKRSAVHSQHGHCTLILENDRFPLPPLSLVECQVYCTHDTYRSSENSVHICNVFFKRLFSRRTCYKTNNVARHYPF